MKKYKVMLSTKAKNLPKVKDGCLLAIEPDDYTKKELKSLKEKGYTLLGYISVGSVSDERSYYKKLQPFTFDQLEDWEHERYLNVAVPFVQKWLINRAKEIIAMGFDGLWVDNLDVYEYYKSVELFNGIVTVMKSFKELGYVMVNGGSVFVSKLINDSLILHKVQIGAYGVKENADKQVKKLEESGIKAIVVEESGLYKVQVGAYSFKPNAQRKLDEVIKAGFAYAKILNVCDSKALPDGVTQEEVFSLIKDYDGKGKFGKQSSKESAYYKKCLLIYLSNGIEAFLLEYTRDKDLKEAIKEYCEKNNIAGFYISEDVNL